MRTPAPTRAPGSRLGPEEGIPEDLTRPGMAELQVLQVLRSRVTRQFGHDHLTDPVGPHPATMDRSFEPAAELNTCDTA